MTEDDKALVYELRKFQPDTTMCNEAADRIEALSAENERLREALTFYGDPQNWKSPSTGFALQYDPTPSQIRLDGGQRARAALGD